MHQLASIIGDSKSPPTTEHNRRHAPRLFLGPEANQHVDDCRFVHDIVTEFFRRLEHAKILFPDDLSTRLHLNGHRDELAVHDALFSIDDLEERRRILRDLILSISRLS